MSARDDLHELVGTTALVLRRGLTVALLGLLVVVLVGGGLLAFFVLALSLAGDSTSRYAINLIFTFGALGFGWLGPGLVFAMPLAAFGASLRARPRLGETLGFALRAAAEVGALLLVGGGCVGAVVASGVFLLGAGLRGPHVLSDVLVGLTGGGLLLLVPYVLAATVLLPVAGALSEPRTDLETLRGLFRGRRTLVLAVGWMPVPPAVALAGPFALPIFGTPEGLQVLFLVAGLAVTGIVTLAASVAAMAMARAALAARSSP